jgi:hypothetical protein
MGNYQEIIEQPFLVTLKMAANQMEKFDLNRALLLTQKNELKDHLYERSMSNEVTHKDFCYMKIVGSELNSIIRQYANIVREIDNDFFFFGRN